MSTFPHRSKIPLFFKKTNKKNAETKSHLSNRGTTTHARLEKACAALLTCVKKWTERAYTKHATHTKGLVDEFLKFMMLKALAKDEKATLLSPSPKN